jgi:putative acetyltransferase
MIRIIEDDLRGPEIAELLKVHLDAMHDQSPPESVHALDLDALRAPDISFWTAWIGDELGGCGAMKELDPGHGEIKSMRTSVKYLRKGVAASILEHIINTARERGYRRLSLETGSSAPFMPAHRLYQRFGFFPCDPYADYTDTTFSQYFTLNL